MYQDATSGASRLPETGEEAEVCMEELLDPPEGELPVGSRVLLNRIAQLHKQHLDLHRAAAQQELDANEAWTAQVVHHKQRLATWPEVPVPSANSAAIQSRSAGENGHRGQQLARPAQAKVQSSLQETITASSKRIPKCARMPSYKSWSYLMQNELANEVGGRIFYTDAPTGETIPASDSDDEERRGEDQLEGPHRECIERVMRQLMAEHGSGPDVVQALAMKFSAANGLVDAKLKSLLKKPEKAEEAEATFHSVLEKCNRNFCRRCRVYNCPIHPGPHVRPLQRLRAAKVTDNKPCGTYCWRSAAGPTGMTGSGDGMQRSSAGNRDGSGLVAAPKRQRGSTNAAGKQRLPDPMPEGKEACDENSSSASFSEWTDFEMSLLRYGLSIYKGDACCTARLIGTRKCCEVHAKGAKMPEAPPSPSTSPLMAPAKRTGSKRKPVIPPRRKNAPTVVSKRHKHDMAKPWPAYTPCQCSGPCTADCTCLQSKNFCEKFCACGCKCTIRFVGCDCKSGCRTKACPCYAAGHECDTDLCKGCSSSVVLKEHSGGTLPCNNMKLRLRQHKRIAMGKSDVQGWGSFLLESANKGDLLGEYTGELVTQVEADRRGKAYDRDDNSYLFNLNEDWVIDARQRGNKLRFANHSADPNCMAKILMVDGDHRVGIFARKDIAPCTELFYDYCYQLDQAPAWAVNCNRGPL